MVLFHQGQWFLRSITTYCLKSLVLRIFPGIVWNPHAIREVCDVRLVPEGARSPSEGGTALGDTVTDYALSTAGSTLTNVACVGYPWSFLLLKPLTTRTPIPC